RNAAAHCRNQGWQHIQRQAAKPFWPFTSASPQSAGRAANTMQSFAKVAPGHLRSLQWVLHRRTWHEQEAQAVADQAIKELRLRAWNQGSRPQSEAGIESAKFCEDVAAKPHVRPDRAMCVGEL